MISKNQLKLLRALAQKKYRKHHNAYLVQGEKNILELFNAQMSVKQLFATTDFINEHNDKIRADDIVEADEEVLSKASTLISNNAAIAIVDMPEQTDVDPNGVILALDGVSDPGNLGTIIRVADWYGLKQVVVSHDSADHFNPKVISASMGSFVRVNVIRTELSSFLADYQGDVYGAYLGGQSVHKTDFSTQGVLVMGSESHGIRESVAPYITHKITIPAFGGAESLNVAMATGIILDNIKRQA